MQFPTRDSHNMEAGRRQVNLLSRVKGPIHSEWRELPHFKRKRKMAAWIVPGGFDHVVDFLQNLLAFGAFPNIEARL